MLQQDAEKKGQPFDGILAVGLSADATATNITPIYMFLANGDYRAVHKRYGKVVVGFLSCLKKKYRESFKCNDPLNVSLPPVQTTPFPVCACFEYSRRLPLSFRSAGARHAEARARLSRLECPLGQASEAREGRYDCGRPPRWYSEKRGTRALPGPLRPPAGVQVPRHVLLRKFSHTETSMQILQHSGE